MPDNLNVTPGSGASVGFDLIGGILYQRVKVNFGTDGSTVDVDATHGLPVDGSGVTQPISAASLPLPSGAATAAKQPALGTAGTASADVLTVQGRAGMVAVLVDGSGVTQPVSAASLPLPAGAATSAKQDTQTTSLQLIDDIVHSGDATLSKYAVIGAVLDDSSTATVTEDNAGSLRMSSRRALLVEGVASGTALPISAASLPLPTGAASAANQATGNTSVANVDTTLGAKANDKSLATDTTAVLAIAILKGISYTLQNGVEVTNDAGSPLPVSGTVTANAGTNLNTSALALESGGNLATVAGAVRAEDAASADGHTGVVALAVRKATPANTSGTDGDYEMLQVSAGRLWASVTVDAALPAGSNAIGAVTQSGTWNVGTVTTVTTVSTVTTVAAVTAITNALPTGTNTIGAVTPLPITAGGCSTYSVNSSGASNQDSAAVKGSAGQLYGVTLFNTTASARYVKLYNKASGATSSDTPTHRFYLPPTGGVSRDFGLGIAFGTGICLRITTGAADSDTGACSANDVLANVDYK